VAQQGAAWPSRVRLSSDIECGLAQWGAAWPNRVRRISDTERGLAMILWYGRAKICTRVRGISDTIVHGVAHILGCGLDQRQRMRHT
jgi:hypothetical protein